jgi:mannose-6-phosphate isomerase-like protein (cupin superfamily)
MPASALRMPGATLATRLKVYDTPSLDGQRGGTPHMHLLCSEMYFVLSGRGFVDMIDWQGFSRQALEVHSALIFSPGTLHRLINPEGDLELFITMQNSGLPERGDNVVSFGSGILSNDALYQHAMQASSFEEAAIRRDRGVAGFLDIKAAFDQSLAEGQTALRRFFELAIERTRPAHAGWQQVIQQGALQEAQTSLDHLTDLAQGQLNYLEQARHFAIQAGQFRTPGFCGALNRYFDPATLELEGKTIELEGKTMPQTSEVV